MTLPPPRENSYRQQGINHVLLCRPRGKLLRLSRKVCPATLALGAMIPGRDTDALHLRHSPRMYDHPRGSRHLTANANRTWRSPDKKGQGSPRRSQEGDRGVQVGEGAGVQDIPSRGMKQPPHPVFQDRPGSQGLAGLLTRGIRSIRKETRRPRRRPTRRPRARSARSSRLGRRARTRSSRTC